MDLNRLAFRAGQYLANRVDDTELPCTHCQGQGMVPKECAYDTPDTECPFCFGLGVDPKSYLRREGA